MSSFAITAIDENGSKQPAIVAVISRCSMLGTPFGTIVLELWKTRNEKCTEERILRGN